MKRVGILLSFVVMGSLYGAETVTIKCRYSEISIRAVSGDGSGYGGIL